MNSSDEINPFTEKRKAIETEMVKCENRLQYSLLKSKWGRVKNSERIFNDMRCRTAGK